MPRYWSDTTVYSQPSAAELKKKAADSVKRSGQKGKKYQPIHPRKKRGDICESWWGQAWCRNLERYADYENRIDRGKSYVRSGAVIDLSVEEGKISAKVQEIGRAHV